MVRIAKIIFVSFYLELLSHLRVKEALFFTFVFPVFIFVLFITIWGNGGQYQGYVKLLLSGIIGMTIASDALFSIGPVIKIYKDNNILKFLRNLPTNILFHFTGIFMSRVAIMVVTICFVCLTSTLLFHYSPSVRELFLFIIGTILGTFLFAFMGLVLSFITRIETGRGLINFVYFIMIFLSGTFYSVDILPNFIQPISSLLPLTHLLSFMRGEINFVFILGGWITVFAVLFYYVFNRVPIKR